MPTRPQIQNAGLSGTREPGPLGALEFERILAAEPSVYKAAILDGVVVEIEQDLADASIQLGYQGEIAARCELDRRTDQVSLVWQADEPCIDRMEVLQILWGMSACIAARINAHAVEKDAPKVEEDCLSL
jgi:hypothetical protein